MSFEHLSDYPRYPGNVWNLVDARFRSPDGEEFHRDIIRSPGSVAVVASVGFDGKLALVRQYRPAFDAWLLELPAGMRDLPDEPADATARRELAEEAGLATDNELSLLIEMAPSPGMTDATCSIYYAEDCYRVPDDRQGPEERYLDVVELTLDDAMGAVLRGEILDAKTIVGLLLAQRSLQVP